jgi:hypothetical protein
MRDTFGRANGDVLAGIERAARSGRRITARRARRQKRSQQSGHGWSIGSLTVTPVVALGLAILVFAGAAGAAVALGGNHAARKEQRRATPARSVTGSTRSSPTTLPGVKGIYIQFPDVAAVVHYMYCTKAAGCGVLKVAKGGRSTISVHSRAGVWSRVQREVIRHDPCINIVENGFNVGKPGDFVMVTTTNLRSVGRQVIKGIAVPARIVGDLGIRFEYPDVPNCTFTGSDSARHVDGPVTEYVPVRG